MASQVQPEHSLAARPTGTVTFLFSDIEGSTVRWERDREAMADAVARHEAIMRDALEAHDGYIFKTMGDEFCVAFARPEDAIVAALDAQRALLREDFSAVDGIRVRIALHTGSASERGGDYFGPAVNRVARLLAIGHGGQVLVSGTATDLLQGVMPPQTSLRDLGAHRLKDLARPEQAYQLIAPDLPQAFPALRSLDQLPNNLPPQLTSFVGREREVAEIKTLLEQYRFVTLVGTGGAGKTRCAIQVGADLLDGSGDGVWLAELAPISDPSLVASVIAQALNVQGEPNRPVLDAVTAFLKRRALLLILDNCEHVIEETRSVVGAILRGCPDIRILATSREGLNVAGERVFRMPSLPFPTRGESGTSDAAIDYGAIALFVDRAVASDGRFTFSEENARYVAEICRRLDGIPLAIELAAARVKVLSPQQLAKKLDERFRVLTGGDRSALPRQQTMRALVDWSYDLLSEEERALFRKLGVFAGGFTLESATAVCTDGRIDEIAMLDLLSSLVDKSLVNAEPAGNGTRYRLLESMRQYARERLTERGEDTSVAEAHAAAFLALAEDLDRRFETTPNRAWSLEAEPEMDNWRAALEWTLIDRNNVPLGQRVAAAMQWMWYFFGLGEGKRWLQTAEATVDESTPSPVVAMIDLAQARLDLSLRERKAGYRAAMRALERFMEIGDERGAAEAQRLAGSALNLIGDPSEAEKLVLQSLATAERLHLRKLIGQARMSLATGRNFAHDTAGARGLFAEALSIARATGDDFLIGAITINLAETEFLSGDVTAALKLVGEAVGTHRRLKDARRAAIALSNMSAYLVVLEQFDDARSCGRDALALSLDVQAEVWRLFSMQHLGAATLFGLSADGDGSPNLMRRAARVLGYVDARLTALEALREYTEQQEYDKMLQSLQTSLGAEELAKLMAEGSKWNEEQAAEEAMAL
jgi:predicted ATPase/class 3 adenylate cyclase